MTKNRRIMVTGASGMLGHDLVCRLESSGYDVAACSRRSLDITNELMVHRALREFKPHALINCAAYTDVAKAEYEIEDAFRVNGVAVGYLANAAKRNNVRFIQISTDYVFSGNKDAPYVENDPPDPVNVYGLSKLRGEVEAFKNHPAPLILRISWLYGRSNNSFLYKIIKQIMSTGSVRVVNDQRGSPTSTAFVSMVIERALKDRFMAGVYHACHDDYASWYDFALAGVRARGYRDHVVEPVSSQHFHSKVTRPKDTRMNNRKLCEAFGLQSFGSWRRGLAVYLERDETTEWQKSSLPCQDH